MRRGCPKTSPPRAPHHQVHDEELFLTTPCGGVRRCPRPQGRGRLGPATLALVLGLAAAYTYPDPPNMDPVVVPEAPVGRHSPAQTLPPPEWRRKFFSSSRSPFLPMILVTMSNVSGGILTFDTIYVIIFLSIYFSVNTKKEHPVVRRGKWFSAVLSLPQ